MNRKLALISSFVAAAAFLAVPVISSAGGKGKNRGRAGNSNTAHLYIHEKDPATWDIVKGGAWGKMKYNLSGSSLKFVFNGHGLMMDGDYTLIYYPDPWPAYDLICLGDGMADEEGNVHIMGDVDTGDLPAEGDENDGAKIWLVASMDVDCEGDDVNPPQMIGWAPEEYLFEYDLITFDDTDE
ncbi:MAG: hypothetical protein ACYTFA_08640 [Planctomycetota bacterium]